VKKISIVIKDNSLFFKYKVRKMEEPNLLNTNVISNNELVFSDEYILENQKIVSLFIADLAKEHDIKNIVVSNNELALLVFDVLKKLDSVECFKIEEDDNLTYAVCEALVNSKCIKKLECFSIAQFMLELLDKNGIKVDSRNEVLFTSKFMAENDLISFSKMYYKTSINVDSVVTEEDISDFKNFLSINRYLKVIHFDKASMKNIKMIVEALVEANEKNIIIEIHEDVEDLDEIDELRAYHKLIKEKYKKNKIKIQLAYSEDYINKNYASQVTFTTLKICAVLILAIVVVALGFVVYSDYKSAKKDAELQASIKELLEVPEDVQGSGSGEEEVDEEGRKIINSYGKLLEVNSDTVGWLKVKGTKIDYPVVKTTDDFYYLNRNFYKDKDYSGWVFMDYRNNIDELDDNTIIYAHNRYTSGVMFGTLENVSKPNFYNKDSNLIISFNTLYKEYKWKIFSFYGIDVTNDYLVTLFLDDEVKEKEKFFKMLKERSEHEFSTQVTKDDKILTLSTCLDNNRRFVVHAVLLKDE
jgi:sortase B